MIVIYWRFHQFFFSNEQCMKWLLDGTKNFCHVFFKLTHYQNATKQSHDTVEYILQVSIKDTFYKSVPISIVRILKL